MVSYGIEKANKKHYTVNKNNLEYTKLQKDLAVPETIEKKKQFINSLGLIPLTENLGSFLQVQCSKGHKFKRPFIKLFRENPTCPYCNVLERIDAVETISSESEFPLKSISNIDDIDISNPFIDFECSNKHITNKRLALFSQDKVYHCKYCEKENKVHFLKELVESFNYTLNELVTEKTLSVTCSSGHTFNREITTFMNAKKSNLQKISCPICKREKKQKFVEMFGLEIISDTIGHHSTLRCINGHTFEKRISYLNPNNTLSNQDIPECPKCYNNILVEWLDTLGFSFRENKGEMLYLTCTEGHNFNRTKSSIKYGATKCPVCFPNNSSQEIEIKEFLNKHNIPYKMNHWGLIYPREVDFFISEHNFAIEFNGVFWHSEANGKSKDYHLNKTERCLEKGVTLLHIFENEWNNSTKRKVWESIILKLANKNERILAENCTLKLVESNEAVKFFYENSLDGYSKGTNFGLYYQDNLVLLFNYNENNKNSTFVYKNFIDVVGGEILLLEEFQKYKKSTDINNIDAVNTVNIRFDRRYITTELDFGTCYYTEPNGYYFNTVGTIFLTKITSDTLEVTENNKFHKIWDCGDMILEYKGNR